MNQLQLKNIISKYITPEVWRPVQSKGWISEIIMEGQTINTHATSITTGIGIENAVRGILEERFSSSNVPRELLGSDMKGITLEQIHNIDVPIISKKRKNENNIKCCPRIYTKLPVEKIVEELTTLVGRKRKECKSWSQTDIYKETNIILNKYINNVSSNDPVVCVIADIILFRSDEGIWYIIEVKSSGDCDSTKTPTTIVYSLLLPFLCLGNVPKKVILGIIQDTKGKNKDGIWKGPFAKYVDNTVYLLEEEFGKFFLPETVAWEDFKTSIRIAMGKY